MTDRIMISEWLARGQNDKARFMVVVCDTFDYEDYPVYVSKDENIKNVVAKYHGPNMQKVMEVYDLDDDLNKQLNMHRVGAGLYF